MPTIHNKVEHYFERIPDYWFHGPQKRFARDAGVSASAFGRLLRGKLRHPRYELVCKVVAHIERKLGVKLDPRDVYTVE